MIFETDSVGRLTVAPMTECETPIGHHQYRLISKNGTILETLRSRKVSAFAAVSAYQLRSLCEINEPCVLQDADRDAIALRFGTDFVAAV